MGRAILFCMAAHSTTPVNEMTPTYDNLWYAAHEKWARADEAARLAEEKVKQIESTLFNHAEESSVEAKKHWVRTQDEYKRAQLEAIQRHTAATLLWGKRKKIEMAMDMWRTRESTKRAEMQLR